MNFFSFLSSPFEDVVSGSVTQHCLKGSIDSLSLYICVLYGGGQIESERNPNPRRHAKSNARPSGRILQDLLT